MFSFWNSLKGTVGRCLAITYPILSIQCAAFNEQISVFVVDLLLGD